jgi:ParB family chromosome partitioning protein
VEAESSVVMKLLSFCAAMSLDAVQRPHETSDRRMAASSCLARSLRLDMSQWWEPTRETYLGRVAKARILEAVKDGVSAEAADNLADLAKDKLVERASERLAGVGWLPPILRS